MPPKQEKKKLKPAIASLYFSLFLFISEFHGGGSHYSSSTTEEETAQRVSLPKKITAQNFVIWVIALFVTFHLHFLPLLGLQDSISHQRMLQNRKFPSTHLNYWSQFHASYKVLKFIVSTFWVAMLKQFLNKLPRNSDESCRADSPRSDDSPRATGRNNHPPGSGGPSSTKKTSSSAVFPTKCSGSETVHMARSLIVARHAGERLLRC